MSDWITDRRPTADDVPQSCDVVFDSQGRVVFSGLIADGEPWKPIPKCEPYVKPKRFTTEKMACTTKFDSVLKIRYAVYDNDAALHCALYIHTREAAERIAAIYDEVMP